MAAPQRQTARGEQKVPFNFRTGIGGWKWAGMVTEGDPSSIDPNRVRLMINGTFRGGSIIARGGQSAVNSTALHDAAACIINLFDFPLGTPRTLTISGDGCPDVHASVGSSISFYEHEQWPNYQPGVYYNGATAQVILGIYGGNLHAGVDLDFRRYQPITPAYGSTQLAVAGGGQDTLLHQFTAGTAISAMQAFDGKLFIGIDDSTTNSEIFYWDGLTMRFDSTALTDKVQRFGLWRDKLIVGFDGTPNNIQVRDIGDAPGTYATVAPGAGTCNFWRSASYAGVLYITTLSDDIFSFDGTTLTQIARTTTGITAGSLTYGIAAAFGNLYIAYDDVSNNAGRLAQFDGSTWTPIVKDFKVDDFTVVEARDLILYRGNLVVVVVKGGNANYLWQSPGSAVTGTWVEQAQSSGPSGPINELQIF